MAISAISSYYSIIVFKRSEIKMKSKDIPFQIIDWTLIPKTEHKGKKGHRLFHRIDDLEGINK